MTRSSPQLLLAASLALGAAFGFVANGQLYAAEPNVSTPGGDATERPVVAAPVALDAQQRARIAAAAADPALQPWQREVMLQLAPEGSTSASVGPTSEGAATAAGTAADLAEGTWVRLPPITARNGHAAIYDPLRDRMVIFGGATAEVWTLSLSGAPVWTCVPLASPVPACTGSASMIYDPVGDRALVFGGESYSAQSDTTWALALAEPMAWTPLATAGPTPTGRTRHTAIYDATSQRMVVFGGYTEFGGLRELNDVHALSLSGTPTWSPLVASGGPPAARSSHSAVYDSRHSRMLIFGGGAGGSSEVWSLTLYDSPAWSVLMPAGAGPTARAAHTAVYDEERDCMTVFGGFVGTSVVNEIWELFVGAQPGWLQVPNPAEPSPRAGHSAIRDPVRKRMIVMGGNTSYWSSSASGETWALAYQLTTAWSPVATAGTPAARAGFTMTYDPPRNRFIVFGGYSGTYRNDVWSLTLGASPAWTQLSPTGTLPHGRAGHAAAYDPARDCLWIVDGYYVDTMLRLLNNVWNLSLSGTPKWTQESPTGAAPAARYGHSVVLHGGLDRLILFGGYDGATAFNDSWALNLAVTPPAWAPVTIASGTPPSVRYAHSAFVDPVGWQMVVYGGTNGASFRADARALQYLNGFRWVAVSPSGTPPPARAGHSVAYDQLRNRMLVFGGTNASGRMNDLWALEFTTYRWVAETPGGSVPAARAGHGAAFAPDADRMVVFGGEAASGLRSDTHVLDLTESHTWSAIETGPPPGTMNPMVYDPLRHRVLLFQSQTWALSLDAPVLWTVLATIPAGGWGTAIYDVPRDRVIMFSGSQLFALSLGGTPAWSQIIPGGTPPPGRSGHSAIYDPVRDRMIVFGGYGGPLEWRNDTWSLTLAGTPQWVPLPASNPPSGRARHVAVYDPIRDRMVIYGGDAGFYSNEVWQLRLSGAPAWSQVSPVGMPLGRYGAHGIYDPVRDRMLVFGGETSYATWTNEVLALQFPGHHWDWVHADGPLPNGRAYGAVAYDSQDDRMVIFGGGPGSFVLGDAWALDLSSVAGVGVDDLPPAPLRLTFAPARPNPSREEVTLEFSLPRAGPVSLRVFDTAGRLVRTLLSGTREAGRYRATWDGHSSRGEQVANGIYFCELKAGAERQVRRIVRLW